VKSQGLRTKKHDGWKDIQLEWLLSSLGRIVASGAPNASFFDLDGDTIEAIIPLFWSTLRLQALCPTHSRRSLGQVSQGGNSLRDELAAAGDGQRRQLVIDALRRLAAEVLGARMEQLDVTAPLSNHGLESLMAGQLRVLIERSTGVNLPAVQIVGGPSIQKLAELIVERLAKRGEIRPSGQPTRSPGNEMILQAGRA
jgi:hypothetical protein